MLRRIALLFQTRLLASAAVVLAVLAAVGNGQPAFATTITVNTTTDELNGDGDCSLREAITAANTDTAVDACPAGSGADTVTVPAGRYTLSIAGTGENAAATGDLDVTGDLTINGAGASSTVIDGGSIDRVFTIDPNGSSITAQISGVTVQNGNTATNGSGIFNAGTLTLTGVTVSGNTATYSGGGIYNYDSTLTLTNSTVGGNTADADGGGIYNWGGTLTLTNSGVSGNTADYAGGIYNESTATLTMTNVTVSGNTATYSGGGILTVATATLTNVTVSSNTAPNGAGIYNFGGTATLTNSIVANGISGGGCWGVITSGGYNLDSDGSCGLTGTGDISNTDPILGPLADNGGPTKTHALLLGSPAIDAGDNGACPATDQRGVARPQGAACDIGAFEFGAPTQGDVDCGGAVNSVDALKLLRYVASLSVSQNEPCDDIGTGDPPQGDVDCNKAANSVDALKVLRYVAGLSVAQTEPCPDVGTPTG